MENNDKPLNGIVRDNKFYEAVEDKTASCLNCHLIDDRGQCDFKEFCFELGRNNIFRFSQSITDKINGK